MSAPTPHPIDYEDVDDIIGVAAELREASADKLSVAELEEVAGELDIPQEYVQKAIDELARRRRAEELAGQRRRRRRLIASGVVAAALLLVLVAGLMGQSGLRALRGAALQQASQVDNVIQRRVAVHALYEGLPATPERDAELAGAENRVRIERQRYDEAVTRYNTRAESFPGTLWTTVFGLPDRLPLSNQRDDW